MSLAAKIAAAQAAEAECQRRREAIAEARAHLAAEVKRTATPGRIVLSGLALGFAVGFREPKAGPSLAGKVLGGPLFSMVLEAVLPGIVAGITAAAGLQEPNEDAETEDAEEPADESEAGDDAEPARGAA